MSEKYKTHPNGTFFVTLTVVGWIDIFTRFEYADLLIKNLNFCIDNKGLEVYAYVIMPSHMHMVAYSARNLGDTLRDFKSYTAKQLMKAISENPQESRKEWLAYMFQYFAGKEKGNRQNHFWQDGNHPIALDGKPDWFQQKVRYIHQNPVSARMVDEPEHIPVPILSIN